VRDHQLQFALDGGEETLDRVAGLALNGGFGLRELAAKGRTLEDVFFELTN
jgi:hypothetical protein